MCKLLGSWSEAMKHRDFAAIADWFICLFFVGGVAALVLAGVAAFFDTWGTPTAASSATPAFASVWTAIGAGLRIFALSLIFASASAVSGWLLGLLFGIPRSLARGVGTPADGHPAVVASATAPATPGAASSASATTSSASTQSSRVNTNLEDISDWLTKTIVGVGLTQLFTVPHYLWYAAARLNDSGFGWPNHGQLLILSLLLYFAPGGFWLGYVGTRTILTKLFDSIDGLEPQLLDVAAKPDNLLLADDAKKPIAAAANPAVANADRTILSKTLKDLTTSTEIAAWGAAQARSGNLNAALTALTDAMRSDPANSSFKELTAIVHSALGQHEEANRLLDDLPMMDITVFNALYEPAPMGYMRAIAVGERLLTRPNQDKNANLHVWLACAYGQKYRWERDNSHATDAALAAIKQNALREIQAAIATDASKRALLRELWKPATGSTENDLAGFAADDADIRALLEPA